MNSGVCFVDKRRQSAIIFYRCTYRSKKVIEIKSAKLPSTSKGGIAGIFLL